MNAIRMLSATSVLALVAALAAGCGDDDEPDLSVAVSSPADGAEVTVPFDVSIDSSVPIGPPDQASHHVHVWFGDDQETFLVVEETTVTITNAPTGVQDMHVSLHLADHTPTGAETSVQLVIGNPGSVDR